MKLRKFATFSDHSIIIPKYGNIVRLHMHISSEMRAKGNGETDQ